MEKLKMFQTTNQIGIFPDFPYLHGHLMTRLSLQRGWF
jgi:hypothetical protein